MKKSNFKLLKRSLILLVITITFLEIGLRLTGFQSYQLPEYSIISTPGQHMLPTEKMGIRLHEGTYSVSINKHLNYHAVHLKNGQRYSGPQNQDSSETTHTVAFYGCSFTYGTGVNDWEAYPYILQQQFPKLKIENHGVPGYGQGQVILDLEKRVHSKTKPDILILNYLSFHNERNTMNSEYQQKVRAGYAISKKIDIGIARFNCSYPYGSIENGTLKIGSRSIKEINSTLPLINYSASMNTLQGIIDRSSVDQQSDEEITLAMIDRIHTICEAQNIKLVISYMTNDAVTQRLITHCNKVSIPTLDIFVDLSKKGNTNAPYDQHPSDQAHQLYAGKIIPFLNDLK